MLKKLDSFFASRAYKRLVKGLVCLTVFVTTYFMILPAVTLEQKNAGENVGIIQESADNSVVSAPIETEEQPEAITGPGKSDELIGDCEEIEEYSEENKEPHNVEEGGDEEGITVAFGGIAEEIIDGELHTMQVHAEADPGAFPEGTTMSVVPVTETDVLTAIGEAVEGNVTAVHAVDITFLNEENEEIEPEPGCPVLLTMVSDAVDAADDQSVVSYDSDNKEASLTEEASFDVSAAKNTKNAHEEGAAVFMTGSSSVYAIVGTTIEDIVLSSDGKNYKVSVTYGPDAGIPYGSSLKADELPCGGEGYNQYLADTAEAVRSEAEYLRNLRIFDIRIEDAAGQKIEPAAFVEVKIEYADPIEANESRNIKVVHFGGEKTEVIEPAVSRDEAGKVDEIIFKTDSFSNYSIVSQESPTDLDGESYALITASNQNAALIGKVHENYANILQGLQVNPTIGGTVQVSGTITMWHFEAVEDSPGWYYVSDGAGNYLNINGQNLALGERQAIYVGTRTRDNTTQYQLRTNENNNQGYAVNNYSNDWRNGFGGWKSSGANNDWFRFYSIEYLGDIRIDFNSNGGSGSAPDPVYGTAGNTVTLPDYTGTRDGYTFLGWSTSTNLLTNIYYPVYPAGSEYTIPDSNTTLYAVWTSNTAATAKFYIRLDGTIPYEPGQYDGSAYTGQISITGAVKNQVWITDNDTTKPDNGLYVENNVTANLNQVPNVNQLVSNINDSYAKLGFKVANQDGNIVVTEITNATVNSSGYNVSVGDSLYVLWYVQKYAGGWHVDGALLVKNRLKISYDGNTSDGSAKNIPLGYQAGKGVTVTVGASKSPSGTVLTPTRTGYNFLGWNTKADGSGTWYQNNESLTLTEDTTLYAQWSKGTNLMTVYKCNDEGEALVGAKFKLEEKTGANSYTEKASRTTNESGVFTYDNMENDTLYRMTETYAPNGYEIQNSFFFKVAADTTDNTTLKLYLCDEDGNYLSDEEKPDWLVISYVPADDPESSGVARIRFNIEDERIERNIRFVKTDDEGNPLAGAVYTLTDEENEPVNNVLLSESGADGVFSEADAVLSYGTYVLTETDAPAAYKISDPVSFTLNDYVSETNTGLTINNGNAEASCEVSTETVEGLTITTYSYTVTVKDEMQAHIRVGKAVNAEGDLSLSDIDTTVYYALTKKGESGYVMKDGAIWIETIEIADGVPTPQEVIFDGVDYGEYDVWEMTLINGQYTRLYNGFGFDGFQLNHVAAASADGGNNAVLSAEDLSAEVDFTNTYGTVSETTTFTAKKRWENRQGVTIEPPEGAAVTFTLYSEKKNAVGEIISGTLTEVRSIELDGTTDPDGEFVSWQATFEYLPIYYEGTLKYSYKVKETSSFGNFYPNNYPEEYYLINSGGTITNKELLTDIVIHKSFDVQPSADDAIRTAAANLSFTLVCPDGTSLAFTLADFDNIAAGGVSDLTKTFTDMPLGSYTLTESGQTELLSAAGYELVYAVSESEAAAEVSFDTEQPTLDTLTLRNVYAKRGNMTVSKNSVTVLQVDEAPVPAAVTGKSYAFVVKRGDLYLQEDGTLGTEPFEFLLGEGESRSFTNIPSGSYTVIEKDASVEGFTWTVTEGTADGDDYTKSVEVPENSETAEAAFDNVYTRIELGSLVINKNVAGGPEEASNKAYKVTVTTVKDETTYWLASDGSLTTAETVLAVTPGTPLQITNVTAGTYTVTEDAEDAAYEDYSLDIRYSDAAEVQVHKDQERAVSITNTYTYLYAPVVVTKTVTGNLGNKDQYFGFDAQLTDAGGNPIVLEDVTNDSGVIKFNLKDGESKEFTKLPIGATLTLTEHNTVHDGANHTVIYTTTVEGVKGTGDDLTNVDAGGTFAEGTGTASYTFTIPDVGATIAFTNDHNVTASVILKKVGYNNTDESTWDLAGAVFKIYADPEKTTLVTLDGKTEFTSDEAGLLYEGVLDAGTYYLEETTVPAGYVGPAGLYVLEVKEDGTVTLKSTGTVGTPDYNDWIETSSDAVTDETTYTVSIRNVTGIELPATGGAGTGIFRIAGFCMIVMAGALLFLRRRNA